MALTMPAGAQWVTFSSQTSARLSAAPGVGASDPQQKTYAWADLDQDGDVDLVVARTAEFQALLGRRDVLLMNEGISEGHSINGVLVDRTAELASAADNGGQGFLDFVADQDVVIVDLNGDNWLDVVMCALP